jgi:hypothetical protein
LAPELGALAITKLAPAHIQAAYGKWAIEGRRDGKSGGLSPRTRRHIHRILKSALGRAVEQQVLSRNPADAFKMAEQLLTLGVRQSGETLVCCRADGLPLQPQSLTHEFTLGEPS